MEIGFADLRGGICKEVDRRRASKEDGNDRVPGQEPSGC
jgi:hypothetical protein